MTDIIKPGTGLLFMKVGTHADEPLSEIIKRKRAEIKSAGFSLWGYGGNTCHPVTMVQPFAHHAQQKGGVIYLCMHPMDSHHFAVTERAKEFSSDGVNWESIPDDINVIGSRFALAIKNLHEESFELPLADTKVAIGTSKGRPGDRYIQGRVDKGCLEVIEHTGEQDPEARTIEVGQVAELVDPFAVFVRN